MILWRFAGIVLVLAALPSCHTAPGPRLGESLAADAGKQLLATRGVVSSAHPLASDAGLTILRRGGNAIDAAVATAFAVGVAEPQMSGLGGGGSMLIWLQRETRAEYVDFSGGTRVASFQNAPRVDASRPELRVVAMPGLVAGLLEAHERFGRLPREDVLAPAIRIAEEGFPVNQILARMIASDSSKLRAFSGSAALLYPEGRPLRPGDLLRQPELGATLRHIATDGRSAFYRGDVGKALITFLNEHQHPATLDDLAGITPRWSRPLCGEYRDWVVLSAPPPKGGLEIIHTLRLLEPHRLAALGLPTRSVSAFDVMASALHVGSAVGGFNEDPAWSHVPAAGVTSRGYAEVKAGLVGTGRAPPQIPPGPDPAAYDETPPGPQCASLEPYGSARRVAVPDWTENGPESDGAGTAAGDETTHISVVDDEGNAVSLTQSIGEVFGTGASVAGFFLNSGGISFFTPAGAAEAQGRSLYRRRPSTTSPTMILQNNRVQMVVGAPGSIWIQPAIVQTIVYVLDYGMDPLDALRMPRMTPMGSHVETEHGFSAEVLGRACAMGYEVTPDAEGYARVYVIVRRGRRWVGAADPRHDGEVRGW